MSAKIYTRKGDDGTTALVGGERVHKSELRLDVYGTVDELNSVIGCALAEINFSTARAELETVRAGLFEIQNTLFNLGSRLACVDGALLKSLPKIDRQKISDFENQMDQMSERLTPLKNFILPGGTKTAALLHLARTVARRAERLTVQLFEQDDVEAISVHYLNRLSDFLFVAARFANVSERAPEIEWKK